MKSKTSMPAKMVMVWASMTCANNRISLSTDFDLEIKNSIMLELTVAVALAGSYDKIWDSIYWNKSRESTKRNVWSSLNRIAFLIYGHLLAANDLIAELPEESKNQSYWQIKQHLFLATTEIEKVHADKINACQLETRKS